ncbi:hypothetical protein F4802DRAFT_292129 [Xylaria palmicola]|nr:hypothetical protein F4802DRAFT_292129 [Xylaria palmicola]
MIFLAKTNLSDCMQRNPRPCGSQQAILSASLSGDRRPIHPARVSAFSTMNGGVIKARTRRSLATPSKVVQAKLLDAAADKGAEPPQSHREQSPVNEGLPQDAVPVPTAKRQLDATLESDPLPVKRARLTRTDAQQPGVQKAEHRDKATLQQPEPRPPKRPYASFLKDFVDPVHPHPRPESLHTFVSEWLESVGSDREKRCRSDSHLHHSEHDPVSRQLTRSAPEMDYTRDADGFAVPPTPASTGSQSYRATTDDSSSTASVRHPSYRRNNLYSNGVDVRPANTQLPGCVSSHVVETLRAERDSPGPSPEQVDGYIDRLETLQRGCSEADVEEFFTDTVFPKNSDLTYGRLAGLENSKLSLMANHLVPNNSESPFRISQPKPDLLYGYSGDPRDGAFTQPQFLAQARLHPRNARFPEATTKGLRFPFFAIEFKAAGGTRGDLWVATNQCAGASAACLNAVDQLNTSLREYSAQSVNNLSYSIAMDNNVAQLYISWKEGDLNYYLQRIDAFLLSSPEHFKDFRNQVRNILDWGKNERLMRIGDALDVILEENRKSASEAAKSRPPPSDGSVASDKKQKSSSCRNSSRPGNSQAQTCAALDGP